MKKFINFGILCAGYAVAQPSEKGFPPNDGSYFYANFRGDPDHYGMRFLDIDVGDTRDELDIWVTIDEEYMGLFTTKCSKSCCNVPNRYNEFDSSTSKIADSTSTEDFLNDSLWMLVISDDVQAYS